MSEQCTGNGIQKGARPTLEQHRLAKLDFIHGKGTTEAIAARYGIKRRTLVFWSNREDWVGLRRAWHQRQEQNLTESVAELPPVTKPAEPDKADWAGVVKAQIERIDELIKDCENPAHLPKLTDSKAKLWQLIFPKPGTSRGRRGTLPGQTQAGPVRLNPVPVAGLGSTLQEPKAEPETEQTPQEPG